MSGLPLLLAAGVKIPLVGVEMLVEDTSRWSFRQFSRGA